MKRLLLLIVLSVTMTLGSYGQQRYKHVVRQNQAKLLEPMQGAVIHPVVAELKMLTTERVSFKYSFNVENISNVMPYLTDFKISALTAALNQEQYMADVMIGALFQIQSTPDGTALEITVTGFPAKYQKFRNATPEDTWMIGIIRDDSSKGKPEQIINNR